MENHWGKDIYPEVRPKNRWGSIYYGALSIPPTMTREKNILSAPETTSKQQLGSKVFEKTIKQLTYPALMDELANPKIIHIGGDDASQMDIAIPLHNIKIIFGVSIQVGLVCRSDDDDQDPDNGFWVLHVDPDDWDRTFKDSDDILKLLDLFDSVYTRSRSKENFIEHLSKKYNIVFNQ